MTGSKVELTLQLIICEDARSKALVLPLYDYEECLPICCLSSACCFTTDNWYKCGTAYALYRHSWVCGNSESLISRGLWYICTLIFYICWKLKYIFTCNKISLIRLFLIGPIFFKNWYVNLYLQVTLGIPGVPKPTHFFNIEIFPTYNVRKKNCTLFRIKNSFSSLKH